MKSELKVATQLPLSEIWNEKGVVSRSRFRHLKSDDLKTLLKESSVAFIVADVGHPLKWINRDDVFRFWKEEAISHIADPDHIDLDAFPDNYAFVASEWRDASNKAIVLLEKFH